MSEHATLAPSSAPQWGNCAGSVKAQAGLPNRETEATREGTAAHWVASEELTSRREGNPPKDCSAYEGRRAPNGIIIDDKMAEGAGIMVEEVFGVWERWQRAGELLVEQRVHMPEIHPTENWGTLDASMYVPSHFLLHVWDYKHGHRDCPAVWNLQLVDYVAGLVSRYGIDGALEQRIRLVVRVVQPFSYSAEGPVKTWTCMLSDLRSAWNTLRRQATEALGPSPTLSTGIWCRDCRAVATCSAARLAGYNFVDLTGEPYAMDNMTGADLAVERQILESGLAVGKARLEAIEDELHHRIQKGETDSGLCLETGRGREKWTIPNEQVLTLCGQLGVDASKGAVKTPRQAREAAPKAVRKMLEQVIATVTRRPPGSLKLVPAGNTKASRAFKPRS